MELYHLERLRAVLDSPKGCGIRLEYLRLPMTPEEQIAYWSSANIDVGKKLDRIEALQLRTIQQLDSSTDLMLNRTSSMFMDLRAELSSTSGPQLGSNLLLGSGPASSEIDIPVLLWLHRILVSGTGMPDSLAGVLRKMALTVQSLDPATGVFVPPAPEDVPELLRAWCADWREGYNRLLSHNQDEKLDVITRAYYEFLRIHPFTDGNGRLGRILLDQMLRELLGVALPPSFAEARIEQQNALLRANSGDLSPLRSLIVAALS